MPRPEAARIRRTLPILLLLLFASGATPPASALERLERRFGLDQGLPFSEVFGLAQDARGFLWIATGGGLFRYDGVEMRPWPATGFRPFVTAVAAGPAGEVVARDYQGRLFEVRGRDLAPLPGPDPDRGAALECPQFGPGGDLFAVGGQTLMRRRPGGRWEPMTRGPLAGLAVECIRSAGEGALLVLTSGGLWTLAADDEAALVAPLAGIVAASRSPGGLTTVLLRDGTVADVGEGPTRVLFRIALRPIDVVRRGDAVWASYDHALVHLEPGRPPEILDLDRGVPSGGPLLVDREASLWIGTFRGLLQFPAPETVAWSGGDGLSPLGARRLARSPVGIWVDTWGGLYLLRGAAGSFKVEPIRGTLTGAVCADPRGSVWSSGKDRLIEIRAGRETAHRVPGLAEVTGCAPGGAGRIWLAADAGLFVAGAKGGGVLKVAPPPFATGGARHVAVVESPTGRVAVSRGEEVCEADALSLAGGRSADWTCAHAEGAGGITSLIAAPSGDLWASTIQAGVLRRHAGRWEPVPGTRTLPGQAVRALRPSPRGGVWVVSYGTVARVEERPGEAGWEVVERPSPLQGLMISDAEDVLDDPDGDLFVATLAGVVRVPAEVRLAVPPVPEVALVDVLVDGRDVTAASPLRLPHDQNRVELRFAGLSFKDPGLLRYQVRLGADRPWVDASGGRPSFRFVDLAPGSYRAEVRASLDGRRWSATTAGFSFAVLPPFWRTWWFMLTAAALLVAAAYALYRYRLAQSLRLERTRTRIAADLHDDIGASLSRIALQSELARRGGAEVAAIDPLLASIGESARAVVDSMSDIVWSIDPRRDDLASVIARVRQFALDLLEPQGIAFTVATPDGAERVRLGPEERRHLYLILKEAVNNIVKHSGASRATIAFAAEGPRLRVEVRDDGRGLSDAPAREAQAPPIASRPRGPRGGHGLENMAYRAAQMGGRLEIRPAPGGGTLIDLHLPLRHGG